MDDFTVNLSGFDELKNVLEKLPEQLQAKALDSAVRAGANVIAKAARDRAPVSTEALSFHDAKAQAPGYLKSQIRARKVSGEHGHYVVGPGRGAFWGLFVEMGSFKSGERHRKIRAKGKKRTYVVGDAGSTGVMPAIPFLRPAFDEKATEALDTIASTLGQQIEKLAIKLAGPLTKTGIFK